MRPQLHLVMALGLLGAGLAAGAGRASAQEIDFGQIQKFESLVTGTLRVGAPPKTIVDDKQPHLVILTIWHARAQTKVVWKPLDGDAARTAILPGKGIQTFKTAGEFKLEAIGKPDRHVDFGYVLLGLKKQQKTF